MKKKLYRILVGITVFIGMFILFSLNINDYNEGKDVVVGREYTGRIHFTQQEYGKFKDWLAQNPSAELKADFILSSPDPLIDFKITTHDDTVSPYGTVSRTYYYYDSSMFGIITTLIIAGGIILYMFIGYSLSEMIW